MYFQILNCVAEQYQIFSKESEEYSTKSFSLSQVQ